MIPEHLRELDLYLDETAQDLGFLLVNPQKTDLLRKQFFAKKKDPVCTYNEIPLDRYAAIKEKLNSFTFKNKPIDKLYLEKKEETIKKCDLYASIGTDAFQKY